MDEDCFIKVTEGVLCQAVARQKICRYALTVVAEFSQTFQWSGVERGFPASPKQRLSHKCSGGLRRRTSRVCILVRALHQRGRRPRSIFEYLRIVNEAIARRHNPGLGETGYN